MEGVLSQGLVLASSAVIERKGGRVEDVITKRGGNKITTVDCLECISVASSKNNILFPILSAINIIITN